ncbi:DEBR0S5_04654g1_1 [Brettanomyces bruxellensis]|uniref:DEBR0S5_04654g1_1 n=1 Tax=Dekkera bruxellensis TaxID=5007 RepID=A0A7D9H4G7_DEKBR|nr:DEBR0S5_04654g1_1 [Brettanomyces bruxellensis]
MEEASNLTEIVPTIDDDVKFVLRRFQQPIIYFGEGPLERRQRLIEFFSKDKNSMESFLSSQAELGKESIAPSKSEEQKDEEFYTPGPDMLFDVRVRIADSSLNRAKIRTDKQRELYQNFDMITELKSRRSYYATLKTMEIEGSQVISNRFTSALKFSYSSAFIAAGSWNGHCYILDPHSLDVKRTFMDVGDGKISTLDWMPHSDEIVATGGSEGNITLLNMSAVHMKKYPKFYGHTDRVTSLQFIPIDSLIASASYDMTWRLWDVETQKSLYYQEGHSKELTSLSCHPDGSLLATAGLDAIIRIWDIRTGKSIAALEKNGHIRAIHGLAWRPNGYQLISGGADNNLKVWDLRRADSAATNTVLAHSKVITDIKISPDDKYITSCGYDGYLNLISSDNFSVIKKFKNVDKLMCCDISSDSKTIITGGWDRSVKIYHTEL